MGPNDNHSLRPTSPFLRLTNRAAKNPCNLFLRHLTVSNLFLNCVQTPPRTEAPQGLLQLEGESLGCPTAPFIGEVKPGDRTPTASTAGSVCTGAGVDTGVACWPDCWPWALLSLTSRLWCRSLVRHCTRLRTGTCTCTLQGMGAFIVSSWCSSTSRPGEQAVQIQAPS